MFDIGPGARPIRGFARYGGDLVAGFLAGVRASWCLRAARVRLVGEFGPVLACGCGARRVPRVFWGILARFLPCPEQPFSLLVLCGDLVCGCLRSGVEFVGRPGVVPVGGVKPGERSGADLGAMLGVAQPCGVFGVVAHGVVFAGGQGIRLARA